MAPNLTLSKSIIIKTTKAKVWEALTNPELIKKYFFGTECITDWKKGSPILYKGTWDGQAYEDKGNIIDIEKEKFILYNFWSSFSGTEDIPENYAQIRYDLDEKNSETVLKVIQGGFQTKELLETSEKNWSYTLEELKKMLEEK